LLRHLEELGVIPGARITVLELSTYDQVMRLQVRGRKEPSILGPAITSQVFVEVFK
jgi:hypothetical protein